MSRSKKGRKQRQAERVLGGEEQPFFISTCPLVTVPSDLGWNKADTDLESDVPIR